MTLKLYEIPFAQEGDREEVLDHKQASGEISYTEGYGPDYAKDLNTDPDAKPIDRKQMNALFNGITANLGWWQKYGYFPHHQNAVYMQGMRCVFDDGAGLQAYVCVEDNTAGVPSIDGALQTGWQLAGSGGGGGMAINGFSLFDTKTTDRILTGNDALGWALQGSYVSQGLYPTAYEHILQDWQTGEMCEDRVQISNINNEVVTVSINYRKALDGHKIAPVANKETIDRLYAQTGIADYYVIDTAGESFYLPRNDRFESLTGDVGKLGEFGQNQITNITGTMVARAQNIDGAFYYTGSGIGIGDGLNNLSTIKFGASKVVNTGAEVQPGNVKRLLYYNVGNTVVNESLIDVGNVVAELDNKASIDGDNFTDVGKNYLTNLIMPNWVAGYGITINTWHKASAACFVYGHCSHQGGHNIQLNILIKDPNGNPVYWPGSAPVEGGGNLFGFYGIGVGGGIFVPADYSFRVNVVGATVMGAAVYPLMGV